MNKNSNSYIILYSTVMVVVVALVLSFASLSLQKKQDENVVIEKKGDILRSVGLAGDADSAPNKAEYIENLYTLYVINSYGVNVKGEKVAGADAFALLRNLKAEYEKREAERVLPIFECNVDGKLKYVIPVWGKGLWGPIWGYIALESDLNTISGVVFDHKGETPGLGAEITSTPFTNQFKGKKIFNGNELVSIAVKKGSATVTSPYSVDAVSGGTITSRGVQDMIKTSLTGYAAFFLKQRNGVVDEPAVVEEPDSVALEKQPEVLPQAIVPAQTPEATTDITVKRRTYYNDPAPVVESQEQPAPRPHRAVEQSVEETPQSALVQTATPAEVEQPAEQQSKPEEVQETVSTPKPESEVAAPQQTTSAQAVPAESTPAPAPSKTESNTENKQENE